MNPTTPLQERRNVIDDKFEEFWADAKRVGMVSDTYKEIIRAAYGIGFIDGEHYNEERTNENTRHAP